MGDLTGRTIRGYELLELAGSGGFGQVYRAHQASVDRDVAIKVILPEFSEHPDFVARFKAEARTVARLEHPHIVPLHDYWHDDQGAFLAMRYLSGGSLRDRLESDGALSPDELVRLLQPICEALQAAHQQGVVHRDLKPENILLDERGEAYLTDFGIAKDLAAPSLTRRGQVMGSASYIAPEQVTADRITPWADIYVLGVLVFELLAGEHPFGDHDPLQVVHHHVSRPLPALTSVRPDLPSALDQVVSKACRKVPGQRYSDANGFWQALNQAVAGKSEAPAAVDGVRMPGFLQERADRETPVPSFVGREHELARLDAALASALEGRGRVVFIAGEAGQGKTALALAFARRAQADQLALYLLTGECNAQAGIGDPYLPFREVLEMLTGGIEPKWAAGTVSTEGARGIWQGLPETTMTLVQQAPDLIDRMVSSARLMQRAELAASPSSGWLGDLKAFASAKNSQLATTSPQQLDLFEQFTRLLRQVSERSPIVVLLDDLQWADEASISLLFHLGRRIADRRILFVCAYRPDEIAHGRDGGRHPLEQVINELVRVHGEEIIDLTLSTEQRGEEFVAALLASEANQLGPEFRQALYDRTGGHPLFTVELLRSLQERGDLRQDELGRWTTNEQIAWDQLPTRVEAVIGERIGRLDQELREVLDVASVEGNEFTAQVLARIQQVEERNLLRELSQELEKRHRLVHEAGQLRSASQVLFRYQFAHQLFQRYLYNNLSDGERILLHSQIAEVLEELFAGAEDRIAAQLAYHYLHGDQPERAARYLRIAGDQAKASYANQEAIRFYTDLLSLLEDPSPERFDALAARAEVYRLVGDGEAWQSDTEGMLALSNQLGDPARRCDALLAQAAVYLETEPTLGREPAEQALDIARELQDSVREGHCLLRLGELAFWGSDPEACIDHLSQAAERYRSEQLHAEAAGALHLMALELGELGRPEEAMEVVTQSLELSRMAKDRRQEATALRRFAILLANEQRHAEALPIAEQALELHREVGDWSEEANAANVLGLIHAWLGNREASEKYFRQCLTIGEELGAAGSTNAVLQATNNLVGYVLWPEGEYEASLAVLDEQVNRALVIEDGRRLSDLYWAQAFTLTFICDYERALEEFERALAIAEEVEPGSWRVLTSVGNIAYCQAELGRIDAAREALSRTREMSQDSLYPDWQVFAHNVSALIGTYDLDSVELPSVLEEAREAVKLSRRIRNWIGELEGLSYAAELCLRLDRVEEALEHSLALMQLMESVPWMPEPHRYHYTCSRALRAAGREEEATEQLRRGYERVMLVAEKTQDPALKRSWLENWRNQETIAEAAERGIQ